MDRKSSYGTNECCGGGGVGYNSYTVLSIGIASLSCTSVAGCMANTTCKATQHNVSSLCPWGSTTEFHSLRLWNDKPPGSNFGTLSELRTGNAELVVDVAPVLTHDAESAALRAHDWRHYPLSHLQLERQRHRDAAKLPRVLPATTIQHLRSKERPLQELRLRPDSPVSHIGLIFRNLNVKLLLYVVLS